MQIPETSTPPPTKAGRQAAAVGWTWTPSEQRCWQLLNPTALFLAPQLPSVLADPASLQWPEGEGYELQPGDPHCTGHVRAAPHHIGSPQSSTVISKWRSSTYHPFTKRRVLEGAEIIASVRGEIGEDATQEMFSKCKANLDRLLRTQGEQSAMLDTLGQLPSELVQPSGSEVGQAFIVIAPSVSKSQLCALPWPSR